jgi:hypothetical protein
VLIALAASVPATGSRASAGAPGIGDGRDARFTVSVLVAPSCRVQIETQRGRNADGEVRLSCSRQTATVALTMDEGSATARRRILARPPASVPVRRTVAPGVDRAVRVTFDF